MIYHNPIVRGYNPDPSIVRVGEEFYLVTSSFEFFPGVPIYRSRNLVNWELIGHCLTNEVQLPLHGARPSGGIYAPTIRHHDGVFFMTTTNVSHGGNFIVHAHDAAGQWSPPHWVDQGGIDPSLLFDEDGRVYFCSTTSGEAGAGIYLCEVDPFTGRRLTPSRFISAGSGGRFVEAPHLYHIGDRYYLMVAEGGTEYGHMETIFRSASPYGPYEPCPHNPILTHRNAMGEQAAIMCTGHADLVEDQNGAWWMVALGVRPLPYAMLHNLGRESFLAPVAWDEDGWPVVGARADGMMALTTEAELPGPAPLPVNDDFEDDGCPEALPLEYCFVRNPHLADYVRSSGRFKIHGRGVPLSSGGSSPSFVGVRQKQWRALAHARLRLEPGSMGGITAFYNDEYHYELCADCRPEGTWLRLNQRVHALEAVTHAVALPSGTESVELYLEADEHDYAFGFVTPTGGRTELGRAAVAGLCTEGTRMMTFTGVFLGLFCERGTVEVERFSVRYGLESIR